jgi:hypothetical protein
MRTRKLKQMLGFYNCHNEITKLRLSALNSFGKRAQYSSPTAVARRLEHPSAEIRLAHPWDGASSTEAIERWSCWALAQADRIDPTIGGSFLVSMRDEDET